MNELIAKLDQLQENKGRSFNPDPSSPPRVSRWQIL